MKKLIIVRHGDFNNNDEETLTKEGELKINITAKKLQAQTLRERILIISSPRKRACNSSKIISKQLGDLTFEEHDILFFGYDDTDNDEMFDLVESKEADTDILILVTHMEQTVLFPGYFSDRKFKKYLDPPRLERGEACIIDCEKVTIQRL